MKISRSMLAGAAGSWSGINSFFPEKSGNMAMAGYDQGSAIAVYESALASILLSQPWVKVMESCLLSLVNRLAKGERSYGEAFEELTELLKLEDLYAFRWTEPNVRGSSAKRRVWQ